MRSTIFLTLLIFIASCTGGKVVHFTNSQSPFSSYTNFKFRDIKEDSIHQTGATIFNLIKSSIKEEMISRGYSEINKQSDLLIHFDLISSYGESNNNSFNPNSPINNYNGYFFDSGRQTDNILKSVLLIELFDIKRRKLVWQASLDLASLKREKRREIMISKAVDRIFTTYQKTAKNN